VNATKAVAAQLGRHRNNTHASHRQRTGSQLERRSQPAVAPPSSSKATAAAARPPATILTKNVELPPCNTEILAKHHRIWGCTTCHRQGGGPTGGPRRRDNSGRARPSLRE
jgi:hypothetical protein